MAERRIFPATGQGVQPGDLGMRDMSIGQSIELEQVSPVAQPATKNETIVLDRASLKRFEVEARRMQGDALGQWVGRLFGRKPAAPAAHEDAMERAIYRCHKRDAEILRRLGESAARALGGRAVTGPMSDHLLDDIGLSRRDIDGFNVPGPRVYNPDVGSTAA